MVAMFTEQAAANDELKERAEKIVLNDLKSQAAADMAVGIQAAQKLRALNGKPLTIEGTQVDGSKFSSADWKGKVVLVDFWATCVRPAARLCRA